MTEYSARFVGEFGEVEYPFDHLVPKIGDVAIIRWPCRADEGGKPGPCFPHLLIRCACGSVDKIPVLPTEGGWTLVSREPVHVEPSVHVSVSERTLCHYFVRGGQLQMLDDTTRPLKAS